MKQDLTDFINTQDKDLRPTLHEYYNLYFKLRANENEVKASDEVLAFFEMNKGELDHQVDHEIDKIQNNNFMGRGIRKRSKKSKKSKKSRKSRSKRSKRRSSRRRN
jgi:hypothetical protein